MVSPVDNTITAIRKKVRRLTASPNENTLSQTDLDEYINTYYNNDFPYAVKIDQMRSVYTFFTQPYVDRYPVDVNYFQGFRDPVYFEGIQGFFYKDRTQFYNLFPRWPTLNTSITYDGTSPFTFTLPGPFIPGEVVIGSSTAAGVTLRFADDGNGIIYMQLPNAQTLVPAPITTLPNAVPPVPGMLNANTGNPGQNAIVNVGTVNYVTGAFSLTFDASYQPNQTTPFDIWTSQYSAGRPYTLLFWNNEMRVRPIPDKVYKVEVEAYQTPVQFMTDTDTPILNQWWQLIAIGAAIKILEDRQDIEGLQNLVPLYDRQEGLALERQGVEEIGQRNTTIFSGTVPTANWNAGFFGGWY